MQKCRSTPFLICIVFYFVRFLIHRVILTASSKYFTAALGPNFQEGSKSEFVLDGTDGETVKAIVDFCYTGHIDLTEENVLKFLAIASSVHLDLLEEKCCRLYDDKLGVTNCIGTLVVADRYSKVGLRQRALDVVCEFFEMVRTEDIQKLDNRLLQEILKSDKIHATEELVFKRLMEWLDCEGDERKQYMAELLKHIRLEYIPTQVSFVGCSHAQYLQ